MIKWGFGKAAIAILLTAFIFTGFFAVFATAEGTNFDDAKEIGEGTYSGTVSDEYYYKVTVPAYKAILVTLEAGSDSDVGLSIYNSEKQDTYEHASAENGATDKAFYDGKSSVDYVIYLKIENYEFLSDSSYTITVEFRPGDVMDGTVEISSGKEISGELKAQGETHWYKIDVPDGNIINVTYTANGGKIDMTLYDSQGKVIDWDYGDKGYVSNELNGEHGTLYIKVTTYEYQQPVSYSFTANVKEGSSVAEEAATGFSMMCLGGIIAVIVVIVLLVVLIMKKKNTGS